MNENSEQNQPEDEPRTFPPSCEGEQINRFNGCCALAPIAERIKTPTSPEQATQKETA